MQAALSRVRNKKEKEPSLWEDFEKSACPSLSRTQRLYGFGICFCLGIGISVIGYIVLISGDVVTFAVLYTLGNIIALASSGFIAGPLKQVKNMCNPKRRIASLVYLIAIILTLVVALATPNPALCIFMIFIQWCALFWYMLSYIPYGRQMVTGCCKNAVGV